MFYHVAILFLTGLCSLSILPVQAQLTPDDSLGTESSVVVPIAPLQDAIAGGATRGANLFHSFAEFNVGEGRSVYFNNPAVIENILTRVTGDNASDLFGKLGVLGNANLWLINPNGIYFGSDATLDIRGSFVATTADGVWLGDTGYFSATDVEGSQLLNIEPGALFHRALTAHQREINNRGNLEVGGDLTLDGGYLDLQGRLEAGGDVTLQASDEVKIRDTVTSPFIASAVGELSIRGNEKIDIFALNHRDSGLFSGENMVLASANPAIGDIHYYAGGNFSILNSETNALGDLASPFDPVIRAAGDVTLGSYMGVSLHILAGGSVTITGDINIMGFDAVNGLQETVTLSDGTTVEIDGIATSILDIRAGTMNFNPVGCTGFCPAYTVGGSTSGDITLMGQVSAFEGQVFLSNQYFPDPALSGDISVNAIDVQGISGGSVMIDSRGTLNIDGEINVSALVTGMTTIPVTTILGSSNISVSTYSGDGGEIKLLSQDNLNLQPNGKLRSNGNVGGEISLESRSHIMAMSSEIFSESNGNISGLTGGTVRIAAARDISFENVSISTVTNGQGNGGNVTIASNQDSNLLNNSYIRSRTNGQGNGGNVTITSNRDSTLNVSYIDSRTAAEGNVGNVTITSNRDSRLSHSSIVSGTSAKGNAGNVTIASNRDSILDGSEINSRTDTEGNAGNVTITSNRDSIVVDRSISSDTNGKGNAGNVTIASNRDTILDGSNISSSTSAEGNAGNVTITSNRDSVLRREISLSDPFIFSNSSGKGNAGNVTIASNRESRFNDSFVSSHAYAEGNAGNVTITSNQDSRLNRSFIFSSTSAEGDAGNVTIASNQDSRLNDSFISSSTSAEGNAGNVTIIATDTTRVQGEIKSSIPLPFISEESRGGIFGTIEKTGTGNAGRIDIQTSHLEIFDGAEIATSTEGRGNGGKVTILATDSIFIQGENDRGEASGIYSTVEQGAIGDGGSIAIETTNLELLDGARIDSSTSGQGNGGFANINARDRMYIQGETSQGEASGIYNTVEATGIGNAGAIAVETSKLELLDGGQISASTAGRGNAGQINVNVRNSLFARGENSQGVGSGVYNAVVATGISNAGSIAIDTNRLELLDGALIDASIFGQGNGGNINIHATDFLRLQGRGSQNFATGIYNAIEETGIGNAGAIAIDTNRLELLDAATIAASTLGQGNAGNININTQSAEITNTAAIAVRSTSSGKAGNINLTGNNLTLRNSAQITAEAASADGGNITLNLQEILLMRHGSRINTTAGTAEAGGNGGNITISALFIIGVPGENSDITANAFEGDGGNISITANAIYGLAFRDQLTPFSDITASSQFGVNGTLVFNSLSFPSEQGLNELPASLVDAESIIGRDACALQDGKIAGGSAFTVTGRGGVPTNPEDVLTHSPYVPQWASHQGDEPRSPVVLGENKSEDNPIRPVQGWHVSADGTVHLTAEGSTPTPNAPALAHPTCQDFSQ